jgi:farnesyl-diphosphate farnesyltransferase
MPAHPAASSLILIHSLQVGSEDEKWCESMLMAVSRSFALVIQQLPADLRRAIGIFYLVLRALDTIEDDPVVPIAVKQAMLVDMYTHLSTKDWTTDVAGEAHEREVLEQFDRVLRVMHTLSPEAQTIITDVTRQMGEGMAKHAEMEGSPDEVAQYDDYCYYVAGLVGVGLTKLFATIGNESA